MKQLLLQSTYLQKFKKPFSVANNLYVLVRDERPTIKHSD